MTTTLKQRLERLRDEMQVEAINNAKNMDDLFADGADAFIPMIVELFQAYEDADFILEGSTAIEGQSEEILDRREAALMRFFGAKINLERLLGNYEKS